MSRQERERLVVLRGVKEGRMKLREAGLVLGLSYRQAKRLWRRWREQGDRGLVHGLRGRPSNRGRAVEAERVGALSAYARQYEDFGPTLAAEHLAEREGIRVDHETLRRWLIGSGQWKVRKDRKRGHRRWRARKEHAGEMVQMDGSDHDWFEGRGPRCVLMVLVDDATGWTWGRFVEAETTTGAMEALREYVQRRGLPRSLYVDRDSIYVVNRVATTRENLENSGPLTQFGRAMRGLGVKVIKAHSPQAKGRVERMNGTLQDRLVKRLRLEGICHLSAANAYLARTYWEEHNARFARPAALAADLHRPPPGAEELGRALSLEETRVVANDYCVRWANRFFQLEGVDANLGLRGRKVTVRQRLDGQVELEYRGRRLAWRELKERPASPPKPRPSLRERVAQGRGTWTPGTDHPWRKANPRPAADACPGAHPGAASAGGPLRSGRTRYARPPSATATTRGKGTFLSESN